LPSLDFHIKKASLVEEASRVQTVIDRKSPLPILENVVVQSLTDQPHSVLFKCTNLENTIYCTTITERVEVPGTLCVNARRLLEIARALPDGIVHLTCEENDGVRIKSGNSNFKIPGSAADSFPSTPQPDVTTMETAVFPITMLRRLIDSVSFAIAPEEDTRYLLRGAKFELDGLEARMIGTDGHRLALATASFPSLISKDWDFIIAERSLQEIIKLLTDAEGETQLTQDGKNLFVQCGDRILITRLMLGEFPDYRQIFEANQHEQRAVVEASDLASSIKRVRLAADAQSSAVRLAFAPDQLSLDAQTSQSGTATDWLPVQYAGPELKLYVNAKFLVEYLGTLASVPVTVEVKDAENALHMFAERDDVNSRYIVMPMDVPA
jgi:DNA polymerase-3 subunit beta